MASVDVSVGVNSLSMKFSAMLFHPERRALRRKSLDVYARLFLYNVSA